MSREINVSKIIAEGDGRTHVGASLYLTVRGGSARWEYQHRLPGAKSLKSEWLGSAVGRAGRPAMTLTAARKARAAIYAGIAAKPRAPRVARVDLEAVTSVPFAQAVEAYLEKKQANFKGGLAGDEAKQRRAALMRLPFAGGSVAAVTEDMVVAALKALPPVQMHRVREWLAGSSRGTGVFKLAVANKWRIDNPAECQDRLPDRPKKKQRMAAMAWKDVPALMSKLREIDSDAARALMFTVLTAPRSGMTTGATWSEITTNGDGDVWEVLGTRMKVDEDWCTPLAPQVMEILGKQGKRAADALLFNLKSNEMLNLLQSFGYTDPKSGRLAVVHGLRSTFRDWCGDNAYPREHAEMSLAHAVGDATERAYARSKLLALRRPLMEAWADFATGGKS